MYGLIQETLLFRTANGLNLLACSFDGSVACVMFTPDEMGRCWTNTEFVSFIYFDEKR